MHAVMWVVLKNVERFWLWILLEHLICKYVGVPNWNPHFGRETVAGDHCPTDTWGDGRHPWAFCIRPSTLISGLCGLLSIFAL